MIDKDFTIILTGAQLNVIGNAIEQTKAVLDVVALDIRTQVNAQLARLEPELQKGGAEQKKPA